MREHSVGNAVKPTMKASWPSKNGCGCAGAVFKSGILLGCVLGFTCSLLSCASGDNFCHEPIPEAARAGKIELKVVQVDSEETDGEDGHGANAVDKNSNSIWHTQWHDQNPAPPHEIVIELNPPSMIKGFTYLPRQDASDHGLIKDYEFYVCDDGKNFGKPVKAGTFASGRDEKVETFEPTKCRFIKLRAISEINGLPWTSAAEIGVIPSNEKSAAKKKLQRKTRQEKDTVVPLD